MKATRTRFSTFEEPELLEPLSTATALPDPAVADTDVLIERIDRELQGPGHWPPIAQLRSWTSAWDRPHMLGWGRIGTMTTIDVPNGEAVGSPRSIGWSSEPIHIVPSAIGPAPTTHLESSLTEIRSWLGIGLDAACHAAGISRGTVYAWRQRGSNPRPGTIAAIMRIHGLVASAVKAVGVERAREWFHAGNPSPLTEMLEAEGDTARLRALSTRVRRELLRVPTPPPNPLLAATSDDVVR